MAASVTATFVFTDLVDSTATAARLGPEGAEGLRQDHFRLLRGAVAASGGTEVKNLGDGLMVMYASPSRALAGAVGMQPRQEGSARGTAARRGIELRVADAVAREGVDGGRADLAAKGGRLAEADVVEQDDQHVRRAGLQVVRLRASLVDGILQARCGLARQRHRRKGKHRAVGGRAGRVRLLPESPGFEPIEFKDGQELTVWGVVTSVIHRVR